MDEAFLREVDAICEEHARSTARKEEKEKKLAEENKGLIEGPLAAAAAMIDDAGPEIATVRLLFHDAPGNGVRIVGVYFIYECGVVDI
jgi:hypothetical protein